MAQAIAEALASSVHSPVVAAQKTEAVSFAAVFSDVQSEVQSEVSAEQAKAIVTENSEPPENAMITEEAEEAVEAVEVPPTISANEANSLSIATSDSVTTSELQKEPNPGTNEAPLFHTEVFNTEAKTPLPEVTKGPAFEASKNDVTPTSDIPLVPTNASQAPIVDAHKTDKTSKTDAENVEPLTSALSFPDFHAHMFRRELENQSIGNGLNHPTPQKQNDLEVPEEIVTDTLQTPTLNFVFSSEPALTNTVQNAPKKLFYSASIKTLTHKTGLGNAIPEKLESAVGKQAIKTPTLKPTKTVKAVLTNPVTLQAIPDIASIPSETTSAVATMPVYENAANHAASSQPTQSGNLTFSDSATQLTQRFQIFKQIEQRMQVLKHQHKQQIEIQLKPAQLGKLKLQLQQEGQLFQLHILAESAITRELLESQMQQLKQQFAHMGFELSDVQVSSENQQQHNAEHQQSRSQGAFYALTAPVPLFSLAESETAPLSYASSGHASDNLNYYHQVNYLA